MKREEVKNKIPGITDEQLDWLMGENGRDVTAEKTKAANLQTQVNDLTTQLNTAKDGLMNMIEGETSTGFAFTIPKERLDNMELLDALAEADNGNVLAVSNAVTLLLGAGQKKALYDHLRTKAGNVPVAAVSAAVREILSGGVQEKNS